MDTTDLEVVHDRQEIMELLVRYCTILDTGDVTTLGDEIYTEDAVVNHGMGKGVLEGREAITAFFVGTRGFAESTVHCLSNVVVSLAGDEATATSYLTAWHWLVATADQGQPRPAEIVALGRSDDALRRTAEGWRVASRVTRPLGLGIGELPQAFQSAFRAKSADESS